MVNGGKHENVPVDQIELDRTNPRIRKFLEMYGDSPSPEAIFLALGAGNDDEPNASSSTTFEKLKQSIITNGGIIQPVILNRRKDGSLVCVEGNTRVALYKDFLKSELKGSWTHIPALVHDEIDDASVHAIRLQIHLVGTRPWDPYSKAKYLHDLRTQEHLPFATIVDYCGGRQSEVVESINAYSDMERYYRSVTDEDGEFDTTRFSGFVELQKPGIKQAINGAGFDCYDFAKWIRDNKLHPLQKVRILPRVLKNEKAREAFLKHGIKRAEALLDKPDLTKTLQEAEIGQLARALVTRIAVLQYDEQQRIKADPGGETAQALIDAQLELSKLLEWLQLGSGDG
ncbi:hypothetical protein HFN97_20580 [Rhizobium laguerreae]|uniref:hypothetical protein n=1 Tax=Rhizobium TaxID=379 RepID=UPI001C91A200|nr:MULTISPECIES: hypothetical protein [Rhizobium]MBY2941839.1 hypothetical protein [Rhizobium leguminosarum]MBY3360194.1 hypothetical protein [Rhizobium laguerreae]